MNIHWLQILRLRLEPIWNDGNLEIIRETFWFGNSENVENLFYPNWQEMSHLNP
jgi:hypothetical protein